MHADARWDTAWEKAFRQMHQSGGPLCTNRNDCVVRPGVAYLNGRERLRTGNAGLAITSMTKVLERHGAMWPEVTALRTGRAATDRHTRQARACDGAVVGAPEHAPTWQHLQGPGQDNTSEAPRPKRKHKSAARDVGRVSTPEPDSPTGLHLLDAQAEQ